jgi:uncharacterized protein YecE (DUF72 family)
VASNRQSGAIRIGVGGWTYGAWRGAFYPEKLPRTRELEYAASRLTSIEINGTYYRSQKPESFARWYGETPEGFVFAVKGPRFVVTRPVLGDAGGAIERFFASGVMELKEKLGPINWQFQPSRRFNAADVAAFLELLPKVVDGRAIRHALEVRNASFCVPEFIALVGEHGFAIVLAGDSAYPQIADTAAPFVYARIMGTQAAEPLGYPPAALDRWAGRANSWAAGLIPDYLQRVGPSEAERLARDVYLYVISGAKQRNPAAALALIERVGRADD